MKKLIIVLAIVVVGAGAYYWMHGNSTDIEKVTASPSQASAADYKNISYKIDGQSILLKNGAAETVVDPGSAEKTSTEYFGNEVRGDFNGDGAQDVAFVLTQDGAGSGTFYYVVAALKTPNGYTGTNAILLGDRIAPQTTEYKNGQIIVNYADRMAGEPFSAEPTVGVSKYLKVSGGKLVEVSQ
jgi:hypothetical protein